MNKLINRGLSIFSALLLLFYQSFFPVVSLAQEATPSAVFSSEPSVSQSPTPEPSPSPTPVPEPSTENPQSSPSGSVEPLPSPTPTPGVYTTEILRKDVTYQFSLNEKVSLTFSKLPQDSGTVTVKEIKLTQEQIKETGSLSDTAYEITSTMEDGTFEYTLTLPNPTNKNVEVKYSEDGQNFTDVSGEKVAQDTVTITGLTHFTVFVVVGTIAGSSSTAFDESNSTVVINEFMFNPRSGNDWVELYNRGSESINLSNWILEDNTSNIATLNGTLYPNGFLAFNVSNRLNAASSGDSIVLKNASGTIVDRVSYKDTTIINGADNVGSVGSGQSVGRTSDGVITGDIWTKYSSPTKGFNNSGDPTFITVDDNRDSYHYSSIRNAVGDITQGGTVNVLAGNYDEADIEVTKQNVTIQGPGIGRGINRAIVNGSSCGDISPSAIFHLHADGITLKGFAIDGSNCGGHGVHIGGGSEEFRVAGVTVTQNVVYSATYGVTISIDSSYDRERPNIVSENDISQNESAGIYLLSASNNIIRDNNIDENESYGIWLDDGGSGPSNNNQILNNTITENSETGIYSGGNSISDLTITGNEITDNYTGIYLEQITDSLTVTDNQITNHDSYGLYLGTISDATVVIGGSGQGTRNTITGNGDDDDGSGIYLQTIQNNSSVSVLNNTVSQNGSSNNDPGIYVGRVSGRQDSLTLRNNTITNNGGRGVDIGSILNRSTLDISDNTVSGNNYEGLFISSINDSVATIRGNTIVRNGVSEGNSGMSLRTIQAIVSTSSATISNNTISENGDRGIDVFRVTNATLTIGPNNIISGNRGTGINLQFRVTGTLITGNTISGNGIESQTTGIVVRKALGNQAHLNNISGNGVGVQNNDQENFFDATINFWGDASGPLHEDLNPNGLGNSVSDRVLFSPFYKDQELTIPTTLELQLLEDILSLIENGIFDLPDDEQGQALVEFLRVLQKVEFDVTTGGGESDVTLPEGVVIERTDDQEFAWADLKLEDIAENILSGLGSGVVVEEAIQWGLPGIELEFKDAAGNPSPITLSIFVGTDLNGQTLTVQRSTTGTSGWTTNGIVSPGTCVVTGGLCTFQATKASYYATTRTAEATTTTSTSGSTQATTTPTGPFPAPTCSDTKPGSAPTLLSASGGSNSVTLTWSKAANPLTYYLATYGLSSGSQQYGNPNIGGVDTASYTVSGLSGGTTYYFKVRAGNGCAPGEFSNELSATPGGGFITGPAAGFAPGVLGVSTQTEGNVGVGDEKSPEVVSGTATGTDPGAALGEQAETKPSGRNWFLVITILFFGIGAGYFLFRKFLRS